MAHVYDSSCVGWREEKQSSARFQQLLLSPPPTAVAGAAWLPLPSRFHSRASPAKSADPLPLMRSGMGQAEDPLVLVLFTATGF